MSVIYYLLLIRCDFEGAFKNRLMIPTLLGYTHSPENKKKQIFLFIVVLPLD